MCFESRQSLAPLPITPRGVSLQSAITRSVMLHLLCNLTAIKLFPPTRVHLRRGIPFKSQLARGLERLTREIVSIVAVIASSSSSFCSRKVTSPMCEGVGDPILVHFRFVVASVCGFLIALASVFIRHRGRRDGCTARPDGSHRSSFRAMVASLGQEIGLWNFLWNWNL